MIAIEQSDWSGDKRQKFQSMMESQSMTAFLEHLNQKRDACIAIRAWSVYSGQPGDASQIEKLIMQIDGAIKVLTMYAKEELIPGSVKIITKP